MFSESGSGPHPSDTYAAPQPSSIHAIAPQLYPAPSLGSAALHRGRPDAASSSTSDRLAALSDATYSAPPALSASTPHMAGAGGTLALSHAASDAAAGPASAAAPVAAH